MGKKCALGRDGPNKHTTAEQYIQSENANQARQEIANAAKNESASSKVCIADLPGGAMSFTVVPRVPARGRRSVRCRLVRPSSGVLAAGGGIGVSAAEVNSDRSWKVPPSGKRRRRRLRCLLREPEVLAYDLGDEGDVYVRVHETDEEREARLCERYAYSPS